MKQPSLPDQHTPIDELKKHVLVVAYYFPPMGLSGVQRIAKLVKYLPQCGWRVTVITPKVGAYFAFDDGLLTELNAVDGVRIVRTKSWDPTRLFKSGGRSTVEFPEEKSRKLFSYLSQLVLLPDNKIGWKKFAFRAAKGTMRADPFDAVLATAPPYTCFLVGRQISIALKKPLMLDYRDDWIDNPRHRYPTQLHRRIALNQEKQAVDQASRVVAINETILKRIKSRTSPTKALFSVVPQGFDPEDFTMKRVDNQAQPTQFVQTQIDGYQAFMEPPVAHSKRLVFVYTGMFYDAQQPDSFLKALSEVFAQRPELKNRILARFVGLFPESKRELITRLGLEDSVQLDGYVPHETSIQILLNSDVAWMTVGHQPGEEQISTGKLFEYIGSGKPILGLVPPGEAKTAIDAYGAGFTTAPENVPQITSQIIQLVEQWERGELPVPRATDQEQFNRKYQAKIVAGFLDNLLQS